MPTKFLKIILSVILLSITSHSAFANLLINPTRVDFLNDTRTTDVTLINTSQTTNTYRIECAEKKVTENGQYQDVTAAQAESLSIASKMLRFSPRQVTLKPNERQTVKLAIRRPQGLADGEYRSHLLFKALAPAEDKNQQDAKASSVSFNIVLSFAIPVVVTQGTAKYDITINDAVINYNPQQKDGSVNVAISRSGTNSVMSNINAFWTPTGGKEVLIAKTGDYNFWPEAKKVNVQLSWVGTEFAKTDGKLRIVCEGTKNFRGKTFCDKTITVKGSAIKTAN